MRKQLVIAGVVGLAVALLAAGCGSGGSDSSSVSVSEGSISKAEFIKEASAACYKLQRQTASKLQHVLASYGGKEPQGKAALKAARIAVAESVLIPAKQREAEQLAELPAPSGDGDQIAAIVEALEKSIRAAQENPETLVTNDAPFHESAELVRKYGLSANC